MWTVSLWEATIISFFLHDSLIPLKKNALVIDTIC